MGSQLPQNSLAVTMRMQLIFFKEGSFGFFSVLYSTLFHLPPLRFHCVGGCWDRLHWLSDAHALSARLDLIHTRLDLIHTLLDLIHTRLDLIHTRLDLIQTRLDLIHIRLDLIHNRLDRIGWSCSVLRFFWEMLHLDYFKPFTHLSIHSQHQWTKQSKEDRTILLSLEFAPPRQLTQP